MSANVAQNFYQTFPKNNLRDSCCRNFGYKTLKSTKFFEFSPETFKKSNYRHYIAPINFTPYASVK